MAVADIACVGEGTDHNFHVVGVVDTGHRIAAGIKITRVQIEGCNKTFMDHHVEMLKSCAMQRSLQQSLAR